MEQWNGNNYLQILLQQDITCLKTWKNQILTDLLSLHKFENYKKGMPVIIDEIMIDNDERNEIMLRIISNNILSSLKNRNNLIISEYTSCRYL